MKSANSIPNSTLHSMQGVFQLHGCVFVFYDSNEKDAVLDEF